MRNLFRAALAAIALLLTLPQGVSGQAMMSPGHAIAAQGDQYLAAQPMPATAEAYVPGVEPISSSCPSCTPCSEYACGAGSCGSCGSCGYGCGPGCGGGILGFSFIKPSDHCFDDFISPMTNPVNFEDPRTLTEARFFFLNHRFPGELGGEGLQLYACQLRVALNEWLSVIAAKDGYIVSQSPLLDDGWADVAAGLKATLWADPQCGRLLSAGFSYEIPAGSTRALQGNGDGEFLMFLSGASRIGRYGHWISNSGIRLAANNSESELIYWSNHFDAQLGCTGIYALTEFNWFHWIRSGDNGVPGIEGNDLINLGSTGVAGNDIVTGAFGLKYKPGRHMELGVAWEVPLTDRRDLLDNRLTADWILRY